MLEIAEVPCAGIQTVLFLAKITSLKAQFRKLELEKRGQ